MDDRMAHDALSSVMAQDAPPAATPITIDEAIARWKDVLSGEDKSVRTITSYSEKLQTVADAAGWRVVQDVGYESAMAFIAARKRNDHAGTAWENGACRHAISAMRSFGKFLEASGLVRPNPLATLCLPKRRPQKHKHPFTAAEARQLIAAAIVRQKRDRRARGHSALVWAAMFWTGLRHSETQAPCKVNPYGGVKWRDVLLDQEFPGIWTDPKWIGNKSKTRDWLPLHHRLVQLLREHRELVPHRPDQPVFPIWPIRATWVDDRAKAKLPSYDDEGRALSVHSTRASYATWLGKLVLPEGLRDRLVRHELGITERVYTTRDKGEMSAAVAQLPDLWPDSDGHPSGYPQGTHSPIQGVDRPKPIGYIVSGAKHDSHTNNASDRPPSALRHIEEQASVRPSEARGVLVEDLQAHPLIGGGGLNPLTLIRGCNLDPELAKATLETLNLLVRRLASRASGNGGSDAIVETPPTPPPP